MSDYKVGYRKPPVHSRFRKGRSGNPKGRSKGSKNFATELQEVLRSPISMQLSDGRIRKVTKRRAAAERVVRDALTGNPVLLRFLIENDRLQGDAEAANPAANELGPEEKAMLDRYVEQLVQQRLAEIQSEAQRKPSKPIVHIRVKGKS